MYLTLVQEPHGMGKPQDSTNHQNGGINQVAAQALATILNSQWQALMANMVCNLAGD
jgi:hypothetical protein